MLQVMDDLRAAMSTSSPSASTCSRRASTTSRALRAARRVQGLRDHRLCQGLPDGVGLAADALLASCGRRLRAAQGGATRSALTDAPRAGDRVPAPARRRAQLAKSTACPDIDPSLAPGWNRRRGWREIVGACRHADWVMDGNFRNVRPAMPRADTSSGSTIRAGLHPPRPDAASRLRRRDRIAGGCPDNSTVILRYVWNFRQQRPRSCAIERFGAQRVIRLERIAARDFSPRRAPDAAIPTKRACGTPPPTCSTSSPTSSAIRNSCRCAARSRCASASRSRKASRPSSPT